MTSHPSLGLDHGRAIATTRSEQPRSRSRGRTAATVSGCARVRGRGAVSATAVAPAQATSRYPTSGVALLLRLDRSQGSLSPTSTRLCSRSASSLEQALDAAPPTWLGTCRAVDPPALGVAPGVRSRACSGRRQCTYLAHSVDPGSRHVPTLISGPRQATGCICRAIPDNGRVPRRDEHVHAWGRSAASGDRELL